MMLVDSPTDCFIVMSIDIPRTIVEKNLLLCIHGASRKSYDTEIMTTLEGRQEQVNEPLTIIVMWIGLVGIMASMSIWLSLCENLFLINRDVFMQSTTSPRRSSGLEFFWNVTMEKKNVVETKVNWKRKTKQNSTAMILLTQKKLYFFV